MIAPIYQLAAPSDAVQSAMVSSWRAMNIKEGWLCSKGYPQPADGNVRFDDNIMKGAQYVVDEGYVDYLDKGPLARKMADDLGYVSASNCTAMVRDAIRYGLIEAKVNNGVGVLTHTEYGREQLFRWEQYIENNS